MFRNSSPLPTKQTILGEAQSSMTCSWKDFPLVFCMTCSNCRPHSPMMPWKTRYEPLLKERPSSMGYYANGTSGPREEEQHIRESIVAIKDVLSLKTTGEEHQEDKEEEVDNSITPPMPHHPWITLLYQWTYPEATHQPTGKGKVAKEDGSKEGTKEG